MGRVDGKVALITGAGGGLGRSHAVTLAREGAKVVVTDISRQVPMVAYDMPGLTGLDETVELVRQAGGECIGIEADATDSAQMDSVIERSVSEFGAVDVLVVNHGIATVQDWDQVTDDVWAKTIDINLTGVWNCIRPTVPRMIERGGGSIILTSSTTALRGYTGMVPYAASKGGVLGLMRALAAELGRHNIRVNAISPGNVATSMYISQPFVDLFVGHEGATLEEMNFPSSAMLLLPIPWLEPQDQSYGVLYLASDESRAVTGINLSIDGGTVNQPPGIPPAARDRIAELEREVEELRSHASTVH